ncbi:MAG: transposase [Thermoproteota archaeon]
MREISPSLVECKSNPHYKDEEVKDWLRDNGDIIEVVWLPEARPELNPVEECWNMLKDELLANRIYPTFGEMREAIAQRIRTKRFKLNLINYLC